MKIRGLCALIAGFAFTSGYAANANTLMELGRPQVSHRLIEKVSCDTRNDDKQARCMQACDDIWIKATQAYNSNIDQAKIDKKACEAKCGC